MLITELVSKLEKLKERLGDIEVEVRNEVGDFNLAETVEMVNISRKKDEPKLRAYIDV